MTIKIGSLRDESTNLDNDATYGSGTILASEANKLQAIVFSKTTLDGSHLSILVENAESSAVENTGSTVVGDIISNVADFFGLTETESTEDLPRYSGIILLHDWNALCSDSRCTDFTCLEVTGFKEDNLELTEPTDLTVSATFITNFRCLNDVFTVILSASEWTSTGTTATFTPATPESPYSIAETYIRQDIYFAIDSISVATFEFYIEMSI